MTLSGAAGCAQVVDVAGGRAPEASRSAASVGALRCKFAPFMLFFKAYLE
jgi:hypothetical protein